MNNEQPRRTSFGMLLRRSKSGDLGKGGRKAQALREAELERQRQASTRIAPKLPEFANHSEQLSKSFGPELRPESPANVPRSADYTAIRPSAEYPRGYGAAAHAAVPVPPLPNGGFDPYARTESMTNRGRYSYASSAISTVNSPRRVRRRKDPTPLNILVIGTRNSGKTSFLEFLKTALALPPKKRAKKGDDEVPQNRNTPSGNFIPHYLETEIDGERVGLTIWDSEGLEKNVVDLQLREMSAFLESKFEETFAEEMKVVRSPGVQDTHIHATFLVLDPSRLDRNIASARNPAINGQQNGHLGARVLGSLDEDLDLQVLRTLQGKTTVIPVIAKADTITTKHMNVLKRSVWDSIKKSGLDPLEALGLDDEDESSVTSERIAEEDEEEDEAGHERGGAQTPESQEFPLQGHRESPAASPSSKRLSTSSIRRHRAQEEAKEKEDEIPFLPLSIISPDLYEPGVIGRQFPWGFADPYNEEHCDFQRLKEAVFSEWRAELREASREQWYEGWRTNRLKQRDVPYRHR
ncbi:septin aspE [Fusarium subglutinans]|uniref:Septin aspE n=2 Tax=Fusarium fujikuroi species complex TaxID=171627 RepID=A0A8H5PHN2_GIBSU|nr:septin aspE [Fusarium subglutinans]KAF5529761.1 septin aspE [Fusarium mexicanum]KAF5596526.1 septin aspE [Fusarium subglutinans]